MNINQINDEHGPKNIDKQTKNDRECRPKNIDKYKPKLSLALAKT